MEAASGDFAPAEHSREAHGGFSRPGVGHLDHMVHVGDGAAAATAVHVSKTCTLLRSLQDQAAQVIGACALMQEGYLRAPFPDGMNPEASYAEFITELNNLTVMIGVHLHRVCADFMPTIARFANAMVEMFHPLGQVLSNRWVIKMADMAAETSLHCRLYPNISRNQMGASSRFMVAPGPLRDRAITLAHPLMMDDPDDSFQMSEPSAPEAP